MGATVSEPLVQGNTELDGKYLTFWTDSQLYGLPVSDVLQIVGVQQITEIPEFPGYAKGVINLRGSIIPVIDIRLRFGKEEIAYTERTCIIIANIKEIYIGILVDSVDEVTDIAEENISPPPLLADSSGTYLTGIGRQPEGKMILLLCTERILPEDQLSLLTEQI